MVKYVKTEKGYIDASIFAPAQFKPAGKSYLTFSSPKSFTMAVNNRTKNWNGTIEYFDYDKTWTTWDGTTILSAYNNDGEYVLYLRGTGNTVITGNGINKNWIITGTDVKCIGNIENLLDYLTVEAGNHPTMTANCYSRMFQDCTSLTQAPSLPATILANFCYISMFSGCTSLTQAPELPATTLANNCYSNMFYGCTSLTKAPELPATTLASYCYVQMFYGCISLTKAPDLPATTLEKSCYSFMFQGCTSLTKAPALPATTLTEGCYSNMFNNCTALTQAPALPATTLMNSCYFSMFENCTSLAKLPALSATTLNGACYLQMFYGCTSLKLSSTQTGEYTQEYRIPSSGTSTSYESNATQAMFASTGGTFTETPEINTTYYLSTYNMIVRDTEVATLNGYVGSMIDESLDIANQAQTTANQAQTTANSKMSSNNPVGTGSFSMGRKTSQTIGISSHAQGDTTTASGESSHGEGVTTTASGNSSHAEGITTTASGENSHAEGFTTTASGDNSHAEGYCTNASGDNSHAEGYFTTAKSSYQHVQGICNVADSSNKYAHIVGNGRSASARSNAHTLDWNGVPWFKGRPQFGGTEQDQGSQTVMANGDKDIILTSSTADSTKKFKITVDDSGALTATEITQ